MSSKNRYKNYNQKESELTMSSSITLSSSTITEKTEITSGGIVEKVPTNTSSSINTSATKTPDLTNKVKSEPVNKSAATAPANSATTETALTPNVRKIDKLLKDFAEAIQRQSMLPERKFDSIAILISITDYLNRTNDPAVYEYFFRYFQRNQNGIMYYDQALIGIHTIQNKMVKSRVSATHAAFVELCRVRAAKHAKYDFTINAMKIMGLSESLAQWILAKSTNRK